MFLEVPFYDDDLIKLIVRLAFNEFFIALLILCCYYPNQKRKAYVFTFIMMNVTVFFICFTLKKLELGLGMALGLFAVFGMLRYRTDQIRIKEMTYLFLVVGLAVINALSNKKTSYAELAFANGVLVLIPAVIERFNNIGKMAQQTVAYDNLELIKPARRAELIADLCERTGLNVQRVQVKRINLCNGSVNLTLYHQASDGDGDGEDSTSEEQA